MKAQKKERIVNIRLPELHIPRRAWASDPDMVLDELTEEFRNAVTAKMNGDDEFTQ